MNSGGGSTACSWSLCSMVPCKDRRWADTQWSSPWLICLTRTYLSGDTSWFL